MATKKNKHYYLYEMKPLALNIMSIILLVIMVFITAFLKIKIDFNKDLLWSLVFLIPYFILHELLHSIGYVLHGAKFKNITFGMHLEKSILCCLCKQNISKRAILTSLLYPFFFIGVITYIVGIITKQPVLIILSIANISGCAGDLMMFYGLFKIKNFEYSEYDNPLAFGLYTKENLSKHNIIGLKYVGMQDTLERKDFKKIVISKTTIIFLLFFYVLLIFDFFLA